MVKLPQKLQLDQMQSQWAAAINPVLVNPLNNANILKNQSLVSGPNVINHRLGASLQGWSIVRMRGVAASIYDTQDTNQTPQLTLNLNSSTAVVVDLMVF